MRRARGFTLIELLAAAALFAVLGTMLFQVLRGAMDVWTRGERQRELHDRATAALELLADDLRGVWLGPGGGLLCTWREEDVDGDGRADWRAPVLRFSRLCREAAWLPALRAAGDAPGGRLASTGRPGESAAELLPSGGLAESLVTLAPQPGRPLPSLVRRMRARLGGQGSLLDPELPAQPDRLYRDAVPLVDDVLWFELRFAATADAAWEPDGQDAPLAFDEWDSSCGLLPGGPDGFPWAAGPASLDEPRDDVLPELVRLDLELALGGAGHGLLALAALMVVFFAAFNVLEALIPSLVSRLAPAQARGTAIGVYNTTQTLGLFCGGLLGGVLAGRYGAQTVYGACAALAALWLAVALRMRAIPERQVNDLADLTFSIASEVDAAGLREALVRVRGVHEVEVSEHERVARLKVVSDDWDEGSVRKLITGGV